MCEGSPKWQMKMKRTENVRTGVDSQSKEMRTLCNSLPGVPSFSPTRPLVPYSSTEVGWGGDGWGS